MDNRFGDIETFLAVASGGSFAAGAKALEVYGSAVFGNGFSPDRKSGG